MRLSTNLSILSILGVAVTLAACGGSSGEEGAAGAAAGLDNAGGTRVATVAGALEGEYVDDAQDVLVFRGVPYARPPVGDARWQPPAAVEAWDGARSATSFAPSAGSGRATCRPCTRGAI